MTASFLMLILFLGADPTDKDAPRLHPLAPSLPLLSKEETARYEKVVERFILYDTGKLPGAPGKKALEDFQRLPPAAIFVLIDGFNQAANFEATCPAVIIGKKIGSILNASDDLQLLAFAKDTLGAGVTDKRHLGMLKDLQFSILLRRGAVQRKLAAAGNLGGVPGQKGPPSMSVGELAKAAEAQKGPQLKAVLVEIEKRQGPKVLETLALAASSEDADVQKLGAGLLAKHASRQTQAKLKDLLKHERPEVKGAAAREIGKRGLRLGGELIDLLQDGDPAVHQAARAALVQLSRGSVDHGPQAEDSVGEREAAQRRWREWWTKQSGK